jgi:uncharacterized protein YbjT (DUF2867 family)
MGTRVLVLGGTGTVGREVVAGLPARGADVRVLVRPTSQSPPGAEPAIGDVHDPASVAAAAAGVDAVFLLWPSFRATGAAGLVRALAGVPRIVHLSAEAARHDPDSVWARVERLVEDSGAEWTILRPTGFAANTLGWAEEVRAGVVHRPYGAAARSLIDERDLAAVAVRALLDPGHAGARYVLSGPATITQAEQARVLGEVAGHPVRWAEQDPAAAAAAFTAVTGAPDLAAAAIRTWAGFVTEPEVVTGTVEEITGRAARSFPDWAEHHAPAFRTNSREDSHVH